MGDYASLRKMVGKKIIGFKYPRFYDDDYKAYLHFPKIYLDDGSILVFNVEEGSAERGISINRFEHPERRQMK